MSERVNYPWRGVTISLGKAASWPSREHYVDTMLEVSAWGFDLCWLRLRVITVRYSTSSIERELKETCMAWALNTQKINAVPVAGEFARQLMQLIYRARSR